MANGFSTVCAVAVGNAYNTTGTISRGSIKRLTPTQIEALFTDGTQWHEMNGLLTHQIEMAACGVPRSGFYEYVMSSNRPGLKRFLTEERVRGSGSLVRPFILGMQESVVNTDYWYVTANQTKAAYDATTSPTLTGVDAGSRVLGVKSTFGTADTDLSGDYFLPGKYLYQLSSASTVATINQWKIVQAGVNSQDATVIDVEVVLTQKTSSEITTANTSAAGIILAGPNNVHNVEAWCRNMVNTNNKKKVPFWIQTMRDARRVDSQYKEVFEKLMSDNAWWAEFQEIPMVERNRQDEVRSRKERLHAILFGTAISANQTLANWASLTAITAASNSYGTSGEGGWAGGQTVGYRANMIGIVPQLHACGQVVDSQEAPIEISTWLESSIYDVWRARDAAGRPASEIDVGMSSSLAKTFLTEYIKYSKQVTGDIVRIGLNDPDAKGTSEFGFPFRRFALYKPEGVSLVVYTDKFFDDFATAASTASVATVGNMAFTLDIGDSIYPAVIESKRQQFTTGKIEDLAKFDATYACRMENPTTETTLTSTTMTTIVECPLRSRVDRNFSTFQHTPA